MRYYSPSTSDYFVSGTNISTEGITRMTEMRDDGAVAFIGPDLNCTNEALVAAAWNLPMIAYVSQSRRREMRFPFFVLPQCPS